MKIKCPKCKQAIPAEQINVSTDLALCQECNDAFKISECLDQARFNTDILENPPKGTWHRKGLNEVIIGGSTRSAGAFFLVPFMCVLSGGSLGGIYGSQIVNGKFNLGMSLFGIPFLLGTILFGTIALMSVCGKVEIIIGRQSQVFTGIGPFGWKRYFDWDSIQTIREDNSWTSQNRHQTAIVLEGKNRLKFGTGLNENRKYYILNTLKYLKANNGQNGDSSFFTETKVRL